MTIYVNGHGWINAVTFEYSKTRLKPIGVKKIRFVESRALAANLPERHDKLTQMVCAYIEHEFKCNYDCCKY